MALKKGFCTHCKGDEDLRIFDVNKDAEVCYCPHCMAAMPPKEAIANYNALIANYLKHASKALFDSTQYLEAYQTFAHIIDLNETIKVAHFGRIISMVHLSTLRKSKIEFALSLHRQEAPKWCHYAETVEEYYHFLLLLLDALASYETRIKKRITTHGIYYDMDCVILYLQRIKEIKDYKEFVAQEAKYFVDNGKEQFKDIIGMVDVSMHAYEEVYNDKSSWVKSNPSLGTVKAISYLEDIMNKSKNDLSTRVTMLCKDFNIKQLESGTWLSFDDLNNETTFDIEFLRDSYAIGGVDLSSTTDLTCALLLVIKEGKKYIVPHFFMPSEVVQKRIQEDSVPYDLWIKRGLITLTDGSQNDFTKVTEWFLQMVREYGIRPLWIGYDPWNAQYWVNEMEEHGFNMEKIRQGIFTLSEPMKQLEADLKNKGVIYDNNPILKWCLANTQAKVDVNGNIQPSKMNSKYKRIDGCVALIIAYAVLNRYKNDYTNMSS